ncbi:MAG: response regulator [Thermodesulfobacteriota bacterium]|nr:response regulator [Thermodesulfobacteriota bacterium]
MTETILIVDDNLDNVTLLDKVLGKAGYRTLKAYNGEEAVKLTRENDPDLILLDIMMPIMDGFTACEILKKDDTTKHIPILMLTAKHEIPDKVKGLEIGADDYITKPFDFRELLARIKSRLKLANEHQRNVSQVRHRALSRMVAGMEHEIRNPVASIGGFARRMLDAFPDDDRKKEYARIILKETERIERMVKQSAALHGLPSGQNIEIDIHSLIDEALIQTADLSDQHRVLIERQYDKSLEPVFLNHDNMLVALIQIISNGLEAIDNGGKLEIRTSPDGTGLKIEISDSGHGIKEQDLKRIFDPFFTSKRSGAGMGLPLTRTIIDSHRGTISIENRPDQQGTRATVTLPYTKRVDAPSNLPL